MYRNKDRRNAINVGADQFNLTLIWFLSQSQVNTRTAERLYHQWTTGERHATWRRGQTKVITSSDTCSTISGNKHNNITSNMQLNLSSIALRAIASMGINTEMFQSAIMSRLKFKAVAPTHISAELNITGGKFKVQALPVTLPEKVAEVQWVWYMTKDCVFKTLKQIVASFSTALTP